MNCKVLLKNGASPNCRDAVGNTPMHLAVSLRNLTLVRLLDEYFADATIKNIDEVSAIDVSVNEDIKNIKYHFIS
jgi:ankyrin repeat protein